MQNLTKFSQTAAGNISTPKNLAVGGTLTVTGAQASAGAVVISNSTASTTSTTGALKVAGGVGVAGAVNVGTTLGVTGTSTVAAVNGSGTVTLSGNTPIALTGTAVTKGVNFAGATVAMSDADNCLLSYGTWNDEVDVGQQTAHFVPIQVHMHSTLTAGFDIAAARLRVDTDGANTENAVGCLQLRQQLGDNIASSAILNASVTVSAAVAVQTGSLLGGYFSIEGSGSITKAGDNDCTVLTAVNKLTGTGGTGVDNVFIAMQNATGTTVDEIIKAVVIAGTATTGVDIRNESGTMTNGMVITNATLGVTSGRAIKVSTTQTAAAMEDGYGVVEIDHTILGTAAGTNHVASALSAWTNIGAGTVQAGKYVCAQNNGVYESATDTTITGAKVIYGMRAQKLLGDTDAKSFAFSLNLNSVAHTAIFEAPTITDMGSGSVMSTGGVSIPFMSDFAGTIYYVNLYTS